MRPLTHDDIIDKRCEEINALAVQGEPIPLHVHAHALSLGIDVQAIIDNPTEIPTYG